MILKTVIDMVEADATITSLSIGGIYPLVYPSGADIDSGVITARTISGYHQPVVGETVMTTRVQFDVWSYEYKITAAIKDALVELFRFNDGLINAGTGDEQRVISTQVDLVFDTFEQNIKAHRAVVDVRIEHEGA